MSVLVISDMAGHGLTLEVNGAKLQMDTSTAYKVAHYISITLDQLAQDHVAKRQQEHLNGEYYAHNTL
jgi:4'-phosphopantetheinyl transferase EntD